MKKKQRKKKPIWFVLLTIRNVDVVDIVDIVVVGRKRTPTTMKSCSFLSLKKPKPQVYTTLRRRTQVMRQRTAYAS